MLKVFSVYDNKAEVYNRPMHVVSLDEVIDACKLMIEDEKIELNPKDYDVFNLGEYDENSGKYELFEAPQHLFNVGKYQTRVEEIKEEAGVTNAE